MGSVWVGRHLQLDVDIAVKFMAPQIATSSDLRARFELEAKAAAMLKSPNAVQVYDYGIEDGTPYIVMELLDGEDLASRLARERCLSLPATLTILEQAGKALRRAHEIGLVHRDLKPGNIFLAHQGGELLVKVVDFGIAKSTGLVGGAQATKPGALLGSPSYMSPEQVRSSNNVDHRTDLWSLGVIAFVCVTGRLPFLGEDFGEVLVEVCTAPIPLASQVAPDLGPEVDAFFQRAFMRDPGQRFQTAAELVDAFAALPGARGAHPAEAAPTSALSRWQSPEHTVLTSKGSHPGHGSHPGSKGFHVTTGSGTEIVPPGAVPPPLPGVATLSPSAHTQFHPAPQRQGRRAGLLIGAALGAAAIGVGLFVLLRPSPSDDGPSAPAGSAPAASAAPTAQTPAPAPAAPTGSASAGEAAPPLATAPTADPSASATAPTPPRSRPAGKPRSLSRKSDDLLKDM